MRSSDALSAPRKTGRFSGWLLRHVSTAIGSLGRLSRQPFASLMIILVIGVTLALPAAMHLVIKNAQLISSSWDNALDFSVYLNSDVSDEAASRLADIVSQRADVERVTLITSEQALQEFREESGFGAALEHLPDNPLPHTLVVRPAASNTEVSMGLLNEELGNLPEADFVQVDTEWVRRFHAILDILERAIAIGAALLAAAIVVIIGNTIRLDIQNRYQEIIVTKLIGATDAFIRRPFLYGGVWYGLLGGITSWLIVEIGFLAISGPLARLNLLYMSDMNLITFSFQDFIILIASSTLLGLAGSWIAVARHLNQIEPT